MILRHHKKSIYIYRLTLLVRSLGVPDVRAYPSSP